MTKLIIAFRGFTNAPETTRQCLSKVFEHKISVFPLQMTYAL